MRRTWSNAMKCVLVGLIMRLVLLPAAALVALGWLLGLWASWVHAQQPTVSLATVEFYLVGGQLAPQPGYQAVPKSLTTQVDVPVVLPDRVRSAGITFGELQPLLPNDLLVKAELRGPAFASP